MFNTLRAASIGVSLISAGMLAGTSAAQVADFCSPDKTCNGLLLIQNKSSATVTSVRIKQESTNGACTTQSETINQNLIGGVAGKAGGSQYKVTVDYGCKYKVSFSTTKGCAGDTTMHIGPKQFADNNTVRLIGDCGTLDTRRVDRTGQDDSNFNLAGSAKV